MKIAITGATGFLGYHVCQKVLELGHQAVKFNSSNLDIRFPITLPHADVLIHLAANPKVYLAKKEIYEDFRINALGTLNVLEAMRKAEIGKIIYISTIMVYKNLFNAKEEDSVGISRATGPYGLSKLVGEFYVRKYAEQYGMHYIIFRPTSLYGPRMYKNAVIDMINGFLKNETIKLYHNISSELDFIYIEDAAEGIVQGLNWDSNILNLSSGKGFKLGDIYLILKKIFGKSVPLEDSKESIKIIGDNNRIKNLGWYPRHSLEEGLEKTVEYFRNLKI